MSISPIIYAYKSISSPTTIAAIRKATIRQTPAKQLAGRTDHTPQISIEQLNTTTYQGTGILRINATQESCNETIDVNAKIDGNTIRYALMPSSPSSSFDLTQDDSTAKTRNELFRLACREFFSANNCDFAYATENIAEGTPTSLNELTENPPTSSFIIIRKPKTLNVDDELSTVKEVTYGHVVKESSFIELSVGSTPFATSAFSGYEPNHREIMDDFHAAVNLVVMKILGEKKTSTAPVMTAQANLNFPNRVFHHGSIMDLSKFFHSPASNYKYN